ncbi:MAG: hypothetical protein Q7S96_04040 [bacterium]|nr:hypothetical protein [bacterium]
MWGKDTCEGTQSISLSWLKQKGMLPTEPKWGHHQITWTRGGSESSVGIEIDTYPDAPYIRFYYTTTSRQDGKKTDYDYKVWLTTTPCHFGGKRYWFICPLIKEGVACRKRVAVLYYGGRYYGCRKCYNLCYESQKETHTGRFGYLNAAWRCTKLCEKNEEMRVRYWKGQPTKRYGTLQRRKAKTGFERGIDAYMAISNAIGN